MAGIEDAHNNTTEQKPSIPAAQRQRPLDERLEELWSVTLPAYLDDWFPQVANAMADGAWTAAWRGVAAYAPVAAFALGLLSRLLWREIDVSYSESLGFMIVVITGAILSGPVGVMLLAGYIVQDLLVGNRVPSYNGPASPVGVLGGKLVSYLLLSLPAIVLPLLARTLTGPFTMRSLTGPKARIAGQVVLNMAIFGALVYLWSQSMLVLIRPLFTLVGSEVTTEATRPVQEQWQWLVLAGGLAAALRVVFVQMYLPRSPRANVAATLQQQRWIGDKKGVLERIPETVRGAVAVAVVTMVLAGTYDGWLDAFIAAVVIGMLTLWRSNLIHKVPVQIRWALFIRKVPPLFRLISVTIVGYALSTLVLVPFWNESKGPRLLMIGSLLTLLMFNVVFPPLPVVQDDAPLSRRADGVH